jgi:RNA polymerase sigma-70 factor (ECF subfamily)
MTGEDTATGGVQRSFHSTLWTVVLAAKDPASPHRKAALETLVQAYWKPLYWFVRRRGNDLETSKDITQGFFASLIEKNFLQSVGREKGKFRTFLLAALQHYLSDHYDRSKALKRGGGVAPFSLNFDEAEAESLVGRSQGETPDQLFRREWAVRVLSQAMQGLREEYAASRRLEEFETLKTHLNYGATAGPSYAELAKQLGVSESDVRNRIHRARVHFRESILKVIRSYTESESECQEELRDLFAAFS